MSLAAVLVAIFGVLTAALALFIATERCAYARRRQRTAGSGSNSNNAQVVSIGIFHPYADGGGGGERVLYCALIALVKRFNRLSAAVSESSALVEPRYSLQLILYSGDDGLTAEKLVANAAELFNLPELVELGVARCLTLVPLTKRDLLEPSQYPRFTLLWESVAQIRLALEAFDESRKRGLYPQLWLDTLGCPFSYLVASLRYGCAVATYTHFPMISTDMIDKVRQRGRGFNNDAAVANSFSRSLAKYVYYRLFAAAYGAVGRYCTDVVMVNSTWTHNHIQSLWGKKPRIVHPACSTMHEFVEFDLEHREPMALSIAQFRPEKNHLLQLQAVKVLVAEHADEMASRFRDFKLVLLGGCRTAEDYNRVENLKSQAIEMGIRDRVEFAVNASFADMKSLMRRSSIGLHTMYNEHFGISNVELMAAGTVLIANNSGGPRFDIVKPGAGFLASSAAEYADKMWTVLTAAPAALTQMRRAARDSSLRFSDEQFEDEFLEAMDDALFGSAHGSAGKMKTK